MEPEGSTPVRAERSAGREGGGRAGGLSGRAAALRVLADLRDGRRTARESIDALVERQVLPPDARGLATELVYGVVRHRITLARILGAVAARGWPRVNQRLRNILMLGAYQVIWLDGVPAFAAVHEAVEQAKREGGGRAGRFVNAILRQLVRDIEHRRLPHAQADPARAILIDRQLSCQFRRAILPDPAHDPIEHLASATSHPAWLVSRWAKAFGVDGAEGICRAGMARPPLFLRPNPSRANADALAERLQSEGIEAEVADDGRGVVVCAAAGLLQSAAFREGWFQPQDRTAMAVVEEMGLRPGQCVIDLCAGPGTKATQMAEIMGNAGAVLASDRDEAKLGMVKAGVQRLGLDMVETVPVDEIESAAARLASIDWILVDAPCSNTGVLARRPEARYRVNARGLEALSRRQGDLLDLASRLARAQTRLLYSTCSIEPEENEQVMQAFGRSHAGWRRDRSRQTLPSAGAAPTDWRDGGYWAMWVRE